MLVSFIVVALNAGEKLQELIKDINAQDYNHQNIEVILVDGNSKDDTKKIMDAFMKSNHNFARICVLNNPKRTLPCGWNIALKESKGEVILRVDAHVSIPNNFIANNVACVKNGEKICGGKVTSIIESDDSWQRTLLLSENSAFGGGVAGFRRSNERRYVDTIAFAMYKREVFDTVGRYDERLTRTEDNEIHYRMKQAGYKFFMDSSIHSFRYARNTLPKMIKQKFLNGYWIGLTMGISPKCFALYHFVPFLFLIAIIITSIVGINGYPILAYMLWGSYFIGSITMSILSLTKEKFSFGFLLLPLLFLMIHLSYGLGTLVGLIKMPFWIEKQISN